MGRRSLISISALNRILSSCNAEKKRKENDQIIRENQSLKKELPPIYSLDDVDFNEDTRIAKLSFQKTIQYRTVERYIQRNYEKYPVYSNWKTKKSFINKIIKLTNSALESLNSNEDDLIREFSFEIITWIKNEDLFPSWFYIKCINEEFKQKNSDQNKILTDAEKDYAKLSNDFKTLIEQNLNKIKEVEQNNSDLQNKINKILKIIEKIKNHKNNLFFSIITFSIYHYLGSLYRLNKFYKKLEHFTALVSQNNKIIKKATDENEEYQNQIKKAKAELDKIFKEVQAQIQNNEHERKNKLQQVIPLQTDLCTDIDSDFIPLKNISGLEYQKIIGCYIIKNRINNKCYVGQSKDVIKRIKQHFKGTFPNNIIFAQDYFSAEDKENLFEIKIIPCSTKDELDRTEKYLIEKYDSYANGYNGTSGNS